MELVVLDFVIRQDQLKKLREDAGSVLEKQPIVRGGGSDHDVAAFFSLCAKVTVENTLHRVHVLRTSTESEDSWISLRWIIPVGKNDFVPDCGSTHPPGLL